MSSQFLNLPQVISITDIVRRFRHVIANDLSPSAAAAMRRNVELNGLGEPTDLSQKPPEGGPSAHVKVNEGDAWYVKVHLFSSGCVY